MSWDRKLASVLVMDPSHESSGYEHLAKQTLLRSSQLLSDSRKLLSYLLGASQSTEAATDKFHTLHRDLGSSSACRPGIHRGNSSTWGELYKHRVRSISQSWAWDTTLLVCQGVNFVVHRGTFLAMTPEGAASHFILRQFKGDSQGFCCIKIGCRRLHMVFMMSLQKRRKKSDFKILFPKTCQIPLQYCCKCSKQTNS